ncbi:MAG: extracellular solute-binding protein [Chloroflexota bacterium]
MTNTKLSRRRFLMIAGQSAAALGLLAACAPAAPAGAPASDGGDAPAAAPAMPVEFLAWGDVVDTSAWQILSDNFVEQSEGMSVNITGVADPGSNFYPKLQTMIAGGTPPHLSSFQGWEWQTYADRDLLAPIDDHIADTGLTAPFPDVNTIEVSTKRNGSTYLIPLQMATMVMFYARKPFDEAGIAYPSDDWTMDDFLSIAEQLTNTEGDNKMYGLQANGNWVRDIHHIRATGAQEFDSLVDPTVSQFNQQEIVDIVQLMASDVYHTLGISPTAADMSGGANTIDTGNAAMKYEGAWYFGRLNNPELREEGKEIEFDVVMMPAGADGERPHRGWSEGVAIPMTDNVEAAWDLAHYMADTEGNKIFAEITGRIPNSYDLVESFWIPTIEERFGVTNGKAFMDAFSRSEVDVIGGVTRTQMWTQVVQPMAYDALTAGDATAAEVLPAVDEGVQALLDEYWADQG